MFNSTVAPRIVVGLALCFCCATAERTVSLTCTPDLMQLTMTFESKFNGRITVLPHRECELRGEGKRLILFPIAFQSSVADQCFLNKLNNDYVGLLEIRNHKTLVLANDVSYLVRCPVHVMPPPSVHPGFDSPPIRAQLFIHPKNEPLDLEMAGIPLEMVVGKAYKITIPVNEGVENQVRMGQCIIFPVGEYERIIELTDTNGCVKNINFAKDFHWIRGEFGWALQTEFEMFGVGLENFAIQCELKRCFGACEPVKCGIETSTQNVDQRSLWLVSAPCRLDQRAISAPSVQRCAEGQCSSSHQFYIIAIILVVLCAVTTAAWLIACWNRPKMKHIKSWINGFSRPERLTDNYSSSRTCTTLPVPTALHSGMKKQAPLINTLVGSVDHSLDAPNLDDLLRERAETKKRLDMDEVSDSSLKKPAATMPTYSIFKSIDSNVIQFPSLDDLPEPPHITVGEIHELNRALNAPRLLEPRPLQRTTTANSVNSVGTTRTIDPIQRRASIASTVDFRPPVFLKNLLNLPKPTSKISFSPDPLKLFSRLSTASSSSSLDITSTGDQKLYSILQDLRKSTAQKEAEIAKTAAENDTKWLKLLSNN